MQSCGIGKLLLEYIKNKKVRLRLNVYQKNARAISFTKEKGSIFSAKDSMMLLVKKNTQCCGNRNRKRTFLGRILYGV